jgi:glycosyltransferase involved in cell wall biosynthesis
MTKNEELALRATLESVRDFAEVFVVDSHSTDHTCDIAEEMGARIVQFTWSGGYPRKKEWSLAELPISQDWVLYLDADELVSPGLATQVRAITSLPSQHSAYDVELDYYFLGQRLRHGHRVTKRVLLRRDATSWPRPDDLGATTMWEVEGHYQPTIAGTVGRLSGRLEHRDPDPLYDYFARHNRYSDWEAHLLCREELAIQVQSIRSNRGRRYARLPFKPLAFFLYSFVGRRGFLDGRAGFHYAVAHAFYFWQINIKHQEFTRRETDRRVAP